MDENIEKESVEIPPMIVQPFVENAVVHGIKQKEEKGIISVEFTLVDHLLKCTVTDNGIGREKARELKSRSSAEHRSSAIDITEQRMKWLSRELHLPATIEIIDLKDADGIPSGTQVILKIPVEGY